MVSFEQEQLPVEAARAGDCEAWGILLARYRLPLYAYVFELIRNEQTALDIVQESFVNAARHIATLRHDHKFGSWLFNIAHQKCVQLWRKHRLDETSIDLLETEFEDEGLDPQEWLMRHEQEERFMKMLDQLAAPHKAVLLLHFVEDFSIEEIAEITCTASGTVKSRLHYAKKSLRKLVEEEE